MPAQVCQQYRTQRFTHRRVRVSTAATQGKTPAAAPNPSPVCVACVYLCLVFGQAHSKLGCYCCHSSQPTCEVNAV